MSSKNGFIKGRLSQNPISKKTSEKGKEFLTSVTNKEFIMLNLKMFMYKISL